MKNSSNSKFRILSVLLIICLLFSNIPFFATASNNDADLQDIQNNSVSSTPLTYMPITLENTFFHIYWTGLKGEEKDAAKGHLADGVGVNGSNALRFGKEGLAFTYYETSLKFHQTGCLEPDTTYVVKMMLKTETGSITQIKLGMMDNSNAGITYVKELSSDELSEVANGWTEVEFEYTPINNVVNQWSSVSFNLKTGNDGGTLLLDDLMVYKKEDTKKTNLFINGAFDKGIRYGTVANNSETPKNYLPYDISANNEFPYIYWHGLSSENANIAKVRLAKNEGINGSNAVKIGALGFPISYYETTFKFAEKGLLESDTKYTVSIKFKKAAGSITSLSLGMLDNGTSASSIYDCQLDSSFISDEWMVFEWDYTPTYEVSAQWSSIAFKMTTGDEGGILLIDDITFYRADDPNRQNIFYKGSFDTNVTMETLEETEPTLGYYKPIDCNVHIYWSDLAGDNKTVAKPRTKENIGFKGTYGVELGAESVVTSYYEASLKFPHTGSLESETKYIVEFKAKSNEKELCTATDGYK